MFYHEFRAIVHIASLGMSVGVTFGQRLWCSSISLNGHSNFECVRVAVHNYFSMIFKGVSDVVTNVGWFLIFEGRWGVGLEFFCKMEDPLILGLGNIFRN
jgi:hypothetical protein